jgi:hypothetical protein
MFISPGFVGWVDRKLLRGLLPEATHASNKSKCGNGAQNENEELHGFHSLPIVLQD